MNHVLCAYDIPEKLKIANPSSRFRRFGIRINNSVWIFPGSSVPAQDIEILKAKGATVRLVEFAEKDEGLILEIAQTELVKHALAMKEYLADRAAKMKAVATQLQAAQDDRPVWKRWRSVLAKVRREIIGMESCAFAFGITRSVEESQAQLRLLLSAEMDAALAWRASRNQVEHGEAA